MRGYGIVIAIALLAVVNAVVLGGAAYNRSGEPDSTVTLTERELPLSSYYRYEERENTGLSLRLNWSRGRTWYGKGVFPKSRDRQAEWFDKAKLESIGFDCAVPLDSIRAELHYSKMLPRKTFAVLEFEGAAWDAWRADEEEELAKMEKKTAAGEVSQKQLKESRKEFERDLRTRSRLFVVDVGNDPAALRSQYGERSRFLVLPATARLSYHRPDRDAVVRKTEPFLEGSIDEILTDTIYVPKRHRLLLEKLLRADEQTWSNDYSPYSERKRDPAYAVTLRIGKRHEPWIESILPLAAQTLK